MDAEIYYKFYYMDQHIKQLENAVKQLTKENNDLRYTRYIMYDKSIKTKTHHNLQAKYYTKRRKYRLWNSNK